MEQDDRLDVQTHGAQSCNGETAGIDADGDTGGEFAADLDSELEVEDGDGKGDRDNETEYVNY
jgi:hypothetical protein